MMTTGELVTKQRSTTSAAPTRGGGSRPHGPSTLNRQSEVPLYLQLEADIRARISSGEWRVGERIASENELNREYGLSRMTVRGVLTTLVGDGLLYRVPGKGTFVAPEKFEAVSLAYRGIREQLESQGFATTTRLIRAEKTLATAAVREALGLADPASHVYAIERVRLVDDEPVSLHRSWVPAALAHGLDGHDPVHHQLCSILEHEYGLVMSHVEEQLESVRLATAEARLLHVRAGTPALRLTDRILDVARRPYELSTVTFRGDKVRLRFEFNL